MNAEQATPEVAEALMRIEMQRQAKEKQLGVPASCGWALHELYGLLAQRRRTPEAAVEDTAQAANVAAVTGAIELLRRLARVTGRRAMLKGAARLQRSWRDARLSRK
jgi:acyl-CoA dehydrogenase-like protein